MARAPEHRRIDREVFEKALHRAVELDADGEPHLTEQDLLDAGRELGIPEHVTRAALREVEGHSLPRHPRPEGTRLSLSIDGETLRLGLPPMRLRHPRMLAMMFWLGGWFAGLAFWTRNAFGLGPVFVALTLFFWFLGLRMLAIFVLAGWRRDELRLFRGTSLLHSQLGPIEWQRTIDPRSVQALLEGYSEPERLWVNETVEDWLAGGKSRA